MIYELNKNEYINAMPLSKYYNIEISAIISGFCSGKIYADSKTNPQTAMIWTKDGSFFIGNPNNRKFNECINKYIDKVIVPMSKCLGIEWLEICSVCTEWDKKIIELFGYRNLYKSNQFVFRMRNINENILDLRELPEDIKIFSASKDFFEKIYINKDYFTDGILDFWGSIDEFCNKGFGYFLTIGDVILSRCTLDYKFNSTCTLGVSTDENHRRCGYAKRVVSEVLKHCKEKGFDPYWDCMECNKGSIALAKSVGFEKDYVYSIYEFKYK
jgi:RimJ/RimL family protein N-acetyltransferase